MIRVLVVDDHAVVRRGLKQILNEEKDIVAVGEAADGMGALAALAAARWDVVVLDLSLPDHNGLEVLGEIRKRWRNLPVLILSMHPEDQLAVRALRAGASGYITKETAPEELVKAIRWVVAGRRYISATLAEHLASSLEAGSQGLPHETLSDREFAVFLKLAEGRRLKEIAGELALSIKTVSTYRTRILEKMGFESNAQLTLYAASHRLISPSS
jgi:two-component system invasion response regulator UvrY